MNVIKPGDFVHVVLMDKRVQIMRVYAVSESGDTIRAKYRIPSGDWKKRIVKPEEIIKLKRSNPLESKVPPKYRRSYAVLHSKVVDRCSSGRLGGFHCRSLFGLISNLLETIEALEARKNLIERLQDERQSA